MRLPGYCTECRRPRQVAVSGHALAKAAATQGIPQGVCDACREREDDQRWLRSRRGARDVLDAVARSRKPITPAEIEVNRIDRKHLPSILRALTERRLVTATRSRDRAYTASPRGLTALRP